MRAVALLFFSTVFLAASPNHVPKQLKDVMSMFAAHGQTVTYQRVAYRIDPFFAATGGLLLYSGLFSLFVASKHACCPRVSTKDCCFAVWRCIGRVGCFFCWAPGCPLYRPEPPKASAPAMV